MEYIIVFVCSFIAFAISAICGGGAGLLLIPVLGNFVGVTQVPAALSIGTASSSVSRIAVFYRNIDWKIVRYFLPTALPAAWLGSWLLSYVNPIWIELAMSLFLIGNLPQVFKKEKIKAPSVEKEMQHWSLLFIGFLAGFISGITGAVGMLFNRFYLKFGLKNDQIVATRAANEVLLHIVKLILYLKFGLFTISVLKIGLCVAIAAILSSLVMKRILPKISTKIFNKVGFSAMVISGIVMLFGFVSKFGEENHATFYTDSVKKGYNTHLAWAEDNYTVEFRWDEGFELEHTIPYDALPVSVKNKVNSDVFPYQFRIFEVVHNISAEEAYEVYYLDKHKNIIKTIEIKENED